MSRAFVSEQDGWNYCLLREQHCKDASLRGECERDACKYGPLPEKKTDEKKPGT